VRGCVGKRVRAIGGCALAALISLASLEGGLRLLPQAIPEGLLKRFDKKLRIDIAQRLFLPNESQTRAAERDDGGPPLQLFKPFSEVRFFFDDTGQSGKIVMDGLGFCNAPGDDSRLTQIQLVAIGDSFTVCHPPAPELAWPSVLGRRTRMTAYNLGRGGYGPYEYVQLLKIIGLAKRPSIVVMQIYEGNDLRDAVWFHRYVDAAPAERARFPDRASLEQYSVDPSPLLENFLSRRSWAYNFVVVASASGLSALKNSSSDDQKVKVDFRYHLNFPEGPVEMNLRNTDKDEVRTALDLRAGRIGLEAFDDALDAFAALSCEHGFRSIITYAPSAHTAYEDFVAFADPSLTNLMPWFSRAQREHLKRRAKALGLEFVDLTPAIQAAVRERRGSSLLYFPINLHYTPDGHEVVAEAVVEALRSRTTSVNCRARDVAR
jgi:hypothetical protein